MPTPTEAELWTQWTAFFHLYETLREAVQTASTGINAYADTAVQSVEGDYASERLAAIEDFKAGLAASMRAGFTRGLNSLLRDFARLKGFPESGDTRAMLGELYLNMEAETPDETLKTRSITFGTPTFSGATGTGVLRRLTKDAYNFDIEGVASLGAGETFNFKIIADQTVSGAEKNREILRVYGAPYRALERVGSGVDTTIRAVSAKDSSTLVSNPTFSQGTTGSSVTGWTITVGTAANTATDTTNYYLADEGETGTALELTASVTLTQKLNTYGRKLDPTVPYYCEIAWNRAVGSAEGTLALHLGSKSTSVVASAQSGWQILYLPLTTDRWYKNFTEADLDLQIVWTRTAGDLLIDRVILVPMTQIGGTWFALVGGGTAFVLNDAGSWSDTETGAVMQNLLADYTGGGYLPHTASPTRADP